MTGARGFPEPRYVDPLVEQPSWHIEDVPVIDGVATFPDGTTVRSSSKVVRVAVADVLPELHEEDVEPEIARLANDVARLSAQLKEQAAIMVRDKPYDWLGAVIADPQAPRYVLDAALTLRDWMMDPAADADDPPAYADDEYNGRIPFR